MKIARELELPAVLNVPGLLTRLSDLTDVRLRVDGDQGLVEIIDPASDREAPETMEAVA